MRTSVPAIHEPITQAVGQAANAPAHPEEIRAKVKLRLGKRSRLNATLRTTPAGLVSAGIMTAAIFLSIDALVRAARRRGGIESYIPKRGRTTCRSDIIRSSSLLPAID